MAKAVRKIKSTKLSSTQQHSKLHVHTDGTVPKIREQLIVTRWLKARILVQLEAVIARQQHGKHVSTATVTDATTEDALFLCSLHQGCITRTSNRRELYDSQYHEMVKYCHESCRTKNQERLCRQGPAAIKQSVSQQSRELQVSSSSSWVAMRNLQC
jgi:hypothetical protein